jgi:hypothetical protein
VRSPADDQQLLLDLPDLEVTETSRPTDGTEILQIGAIDTSAWPVEVSVTRRRYRDGSSRCISLTFAPAETPGDWWSVQVTPEQARHAAAQLVKAAAVAEQEKHTTAACPVGPLEIEQENQGD